MAFLDFNKIPAMNLGKRQTMFKREDTADFLETTIKDNFFDSATPSSSTILPSNPSSDILNQIGIIGNKISQPKSMPKSFIQFDSFPEMELESLIGFESHRHKKKPKREITWKMTKQEETDDTLMRSSSLLPRDLIQNGQDSQKKHKKRR